MQHSAQQADGTGAGPAWEVYSQQLCLCPPRQPLPVQVDVQHLIVLPGAVACPAVFAFTLAGVHLVEP